MPAMDGFEMMRCIRSINPKVKTIYVSGAIERFEKDVELEGASVRRCRSAEAYINNGLIGTDVHGIRQGASVVRGQSWRTRQSWLLIAKRISE